MTYAHKIAALIEDNTGDDGSFSTILPGVFLLRTSRTTEPDHTFYEPSLCYVAQGRKRVSVGAFAIDYEPGAALAVSVGLPACGEVVAASPEAPFLCLRLELRNETITDLRNHLDLRPIASGLTPGLGVLQPSSSLEDALLRTMQLLAEPKDARVIWPLLEREISYHLLAQRDTRVIEQLCSQHTEFEGVSRAVDFLRRHFKQAVGIEDAARSIGQKTGKLNRNFQRVAGMTVADYIRHLRLQEGRRLMMLGVKDPTELACAVGYRKGADFVSDYAKTFRRAITDEISTRSSGAMLADPE